MPPIVNAFTGLCRGIVKILVPSVITICEPCRSMRNPAFSSAATALRWFTPGIFGIHHPWNFTGCAGLAIPRAHLFLLSCCHFHDTAVLIASQFLRCFDILTDRDLNIGQRLCLRGALRPATGQTGTRNTVAFFGFAKNDAIARHKRYVTPAGDGTPEACSYSCAAHGS